MTTQEHRIVKCIIEGLEKTANEYGCNGNAHSALISEALNKCGVNICAALKEIQNQQVKVTLNQYQDAVENNHGYCTMCKRFVDKFAESDAQEYLCPDCNNYTVYGAEESLIREDITI